MDAMRQKPSGFHAANEHPLNLPGRNAFLAGAHQMDDLQPKMQRQVRGLEDRPLAHRERLAALIAFAKAETGGLAGKLADALGIGIATMRAAWTMRPKLAFDVSESGGFGLELRGIENGICHD